MAKAIKEGLYSWDSDDISLCGRLTLQLHETARVMVLDSQVTVAYAHFVMDGDTGITRGVACGRAAGLPCSHCEAGELPVPRFGCVVVNYTRVPPQCEWELIPWTFGRDKYLRLRRLVETGVDFRHRDLMLTCFNPRFQNFQIEVCETALWDEDTALRGPIIEEYKAARPNVLELLVSRSGRGKTGRSSLRSPQTAPVTPVASSPPPRQRPPASRPDTPAAIEQAAGRREWPLCPHCKTRKLETYDERIAGVCVLCQEARTGAAKPQSPAVAPEAASPQAPEPLPELSPEPPTGQAAAKPEITPRVSDDEEVDDILNNILGEQDFGVK